jgi:dihydroorotate dehydrogenase
VPSLDIYQLIGRPLLFGALKADPEDVQRTILNFLAAIDHSHSPVATALQASLPQLFSITDPRLEQQLWGKSFANPIGLAAGFDKDGVAPNIWPKLGFGFAELGTVTYHGQPGNDRPRLFRFPTDQAALNWMGFNNLGSASLAERLQSQPLPTAPLGLNLGKSKVTPEDQAAGDYAGSFKRLRNCGDYFVINVSSPNTPGLRILQDVSFLVRIIDAIQALNPDRKPLLVKIAPDLAWEDIEAIVNLSLERGLAGIIATNTTSDKSVLSSKTINGQPIDPQKGGVSGAPLRDRSTEIIRFIYRTSGGQLPIIGVGGIFNADDAWAKIIAGASLIQLYTGWIYEGPWLVSRILSGLLTRLEAAKFQNITEAIGSAEPDIKKIIGS